MINAIIIIKRLINLKASKFFNRARSGFKLFDILMVFLKEFFKKLILKKISIQQTTKEHAKFPSRQSYYEL